MSLLTELNPNSWFASINIWLLTEPGTAALNDKLANPSIYALLLTRSVSFSKTNASVL
jgi:hypothetical protein